MKRLGVVLSVLLLVVASAFFARPCQAGEMQNASVQLSNTLHGAECSHTYSFVTRSPGEIKGVRIDYRPLPTTERIPQGLSFSGLPSSVQPAYGLTGAWQINSTISITMTSEIDSIYLTRPSGGMVSMGTSVGFTLSGISNPFITLPGQMGPPGCIAPDNEGKTGVGYVRIETYCTSNIEEMQKRNPDYLLDYTTVSYTVTSHPRVYRGTYRVTSVYDITGGGSRVFFAEKTDRSSSIEVIYPVPCARDGQEITLWDGEVWPTADGHKLLWMPQMADCQVFDPLSPVITISQKVLDGLNGVGLSLPGYRVTICGKSKVYYGAGMKRVAIDDGSGTTNEYGKGVLLVYNYFGKWNGELIASIPDNAMVAVTGVVIPTLQSDGKVGFELLPQSYTVCN